MADFIVTAAAMRPASEDRCCFYCKQPIGAHHKLSCVLVRRKVRVRAIIEYDVSVPSTWTPEEIDFHRN